MRPAIAPASPVQGSEPSTLRVLIVTDAWAPQVNGVVRTLEMLGRTNAIEFTTEQRDDAWIGGAELVPSQWGIAPVTAMLGTLRLEDRVQVAFSVSIDLVRTE